MQNFQCNGEKGNITSTSILEMTTLGMLSFMALQVASVKIWCQSATAVVVSGQLPDLAGLLDAFAKEHQLILNLNCWWRNLYQWSLAGNLPWISSWRWDQWWDLLGPLVEPTWLGGDAKAYLQVTARVLHETTGSEISIRMLNRCSLSTPECLGVFVHLQ